MAMDNYLVNGSALVYVGTGVGGALQLLGYTDYGVDMKVTQHKLELYTDLLGPRTPQDFQDMGMTATISVPLIATDSVVQATVQSVGNMTVAGRISTPGLVLGIGVAGPIVYRFRVAIASPLGVAPWSFPYCVLKNTFGTKLATKANPFTIEFTAWPWCSYTATTGLDTVLYTRSLS